MSDLTIEKRVEALEAKVTILATGFNAILTELAGIGEAEKAEKDKPSPSWSPTKINWVQTKGTRGIYGRYPAESQKAENTTDYKNMLADLKEHNGKLTRDGYFFWLFQDDATVGRKKRKF